MKKIFSSIMIGDGDSAMAFSCSKYTKERAINEFKLTCPGVEIKDYEPFITYYRYITKDEVLNDGDWEIIMGYDDGSMSLFEECEPTDRGAFKCWVIGD